MGDNSDFHCDLALNICVSVSIYTLAISLSVSYYPKYTHQKQ